MGNIEILEFYEHKIDSSLFVMMDKNYRIHWCYSGNELRRIYLESPEDFISGPLELPIPDYLDKELKYVLDNY